MAQAQQWEQAERVIGTIEKGSWQAKAIHELSIAMASAYEFELLLYLIQKTWGKVETRGEALKLFTISNAFISYKPQIGIAFFDAFTWVNTFLGG